MKIHKCIRRRASSRTRLMKARARNEINGGEKREGQKKNVSDFCRKNPPREFFSISREIFYLPTRVSAGRCNFKKFRASPSPPCLCALAFLRSSALLEANRRLRRLDGKLNYKDSDWLDPPEKSLDRFRIFSARR